ncbi:uncharacterized protein [Ambystoma mexicanum]|uniref:uncharacterized protein n=1 Tax=Ambystoma mexicanum TaxID=8296 RepID=UPI0037E7B5FD
MATDGKPSESVRRLRRKLTEILQSDTDVVLDELDSLLLITQEEYFKLSEISDAEKRVRAILNTVLQKGEPACQTFMDSLKNLQNSFPGLVLLVEDSGDGLVADAKLQESQKVIKMEEFEGPVSEWRIQEGLEEIKKEQFNASIAERKMHTRWQERMEENIDGSLTEAKMEINMIEITDEDFDVGCSAAAVRTSTRRSRSYRPRHWDTEYIAATLKPRKRAFNFSQDEVRLLVDRVRVHEDALFGQGKHKLAQAARRKLWENIAAEVSSLGVAHRSVKDVKKRWDDLKRRTKQKQTLIQWHSQGRGRGSPCSVRLHATERVVAGMLLPATESRHSGSHTNPKETGTACDERQPGTWSVQPNPKVHHEILSCKKADSSDDEREATSGPSGAEAQPATEYFCSEEEDADRTSASHTPSSGGGESQSECELQVTGRSAATPSVHPVKEPAPHTAIDSEGEESMLGGSLATATPSVTPVPPQSGPSTEHSTPHGRNRGSWGGRVGPRHLLPQSLSWEEEVIAQQAQMQQIINSLCFTLADGQSQIAGAINNLASTMSLSFRQWSDLQIQQHKVLVSTLQSLAIHNSPNPLLVPSADTVLPTSHKDEAPSPDSLSPQGAVTGSSTASCTTMPASVPFTQGQDCCDLTHRLKLPAAVWRSRRRQQPPQPKAASIKRHRRT